MEKVSIIIPVYNAEKFIAETIQSVLNQTYTNWELIIVDDGSVDQSKEIISKFLYDTRVKYCHQKNAGVSASRNNGFQRSTSNLIAFLDSDDLWLPLNLEKKMLFLTQNKNYGLVHSNMNTIDEQSNHLNIKYSGKEGWILKDLLLWNECCIPGPSSILLNRYVMEEIGEWCINLSTAADQEFFFRIAKKYKIGKINESLGLYRMHKNNMHKNIQLMEKDHILAYNKASTNNLFYNVWFKKKCFSNLFLTLAGSYWVNGNNKTRGIYFLLKSILYYPPIAYKILRKTIR
jgi:glycosyltransferase involved in cell wall biosynthesis